MSNSLSYITIWNVIIPVLGAPLSQPYGTSPEPPWKTEPSGRGSFGILLNCVLTLFLCVWTTIHLDFCPDRLWWQELQTRLGFVITAMLAPEIVLAQAGVQWVKARELRVAWCKARSEETEIPVKVGSPEDTFGMAGAYLVCMGGVLIFPPHWFATSSNTVSSEGFCRLLRNDPLKRTNIDQTVAKNKTKTDAMGKTIVCVQGTWMIVQCIARKATGLPVTLLELHIAMNVICALIMYICWWDKPQGLTEPLALLQDVADPCLYSLVSAGYAIEPTRSAAESAVSEENNNRATSEEILPQRLAYFRLGEGEREMVDLGENEQIILGAERLIDHSECLIINDNLKITKGEKSKPVELGKSEFDALFRMAEKFETILPALSVRDTANGPQSPTVMNTLSGGISSQLVATKRSTALAAGIILTYGACHAAAWNTHFPSTLECYLWRVSAIVVAVCPCISIILIYHEKLTGLYWPDFLFDKYYGTRAPYWFNLMERLISFMLLGVVIVGRAFLLVESFISLRSLPEGSFKTTVWDDYWPHL